MSARFAPLPVGRHARLSPLDRARRALAGRPRPQLLMIMIVMLSFALGFTLAGVML